LRERDLEMASMTRTDSGSTVTYVITDMGGNTVSAVVTQTAVTGNTVVFSSSGGLLSDGLAMLMILTQLLATGLLPPATVPAY
jgi:hypothetical protein